MYNKLNITENYLKVLALFTKGYDKEYYIREVHKLLRISPRTAQLLLNDLEKKTVLLSRRRGKIKTYSIRNTVLAKEYLILAEQYKKICLFQNKPLIKEVITKIIPYIKGVGVIFGSYAKGLERKDSDLDVFIIGACNINNIKKASKTYGVNISVKTYPLKVVKKNLRKDVLIKEVLNNHVVFLNVERFVRLVLNE